MKSSKKELRINSLKGGNGDIWMRLVGLYVLACLVPELKISILVPKFLIKLARYTFGDRLSIVDENSSSIRLCYTSLGIRDVMAGIINGNRYIAPYHRAVIRDKKKKGVKDYVNVALFTAADYLALIQVPSWRWINVYQGYLEVAALKVFRNVSYQQFVEQLNSVCTILKSRLSGDLPISPQLIIPADLRNSVVVFPTGTSRQFIPVWWAKTNLPEAYFAFFYKDNDALLFQAHGLKTVLFYDEPGDIIKLSRCASWTISTDSFPSHLLQYATERCTITITEVLRSRIVSPVFRGKVVDAEVTCHPCLHLARDISSLCAAGYAECQNWKSSIYTQNVLSSLG